MTKKSQKGWIGVDFDGTLAYYDGWRGHRHLGEPVPEMAERVRNWLAEGREVRIFTARVALATAGFSEAEETADLIIAWCVRHLGRELKVTCLKDKDMDELWDDRAVQVRTNTGEPVGPQFLTRSST